AAAPQHQRRDEGDCYGAGIVIRLTASRVSINIMDFKLPELGEGIYEAELVAWLVKPGDPVKRGQNLIEVLTDKATMEVPSPFAGNISSWKAQQGQNIKVGEVVLAYSPTGQQGNGKKKAATKEAAATASAGHKPPEEKHIAGAAPTTGGLRPPLAELSSR